MAKTLLQYSCLYILPFLFGMCLCGLEQEQFLTVGKTGQVRRVGRGRFLVVELSQPHAKKGVLNFTQVIKLEPIKGLTGPGPSGQTDKVSVYMKKAINGMDEDAVGVVLNEAANDLDNWNDFQIHGDPTEVDGNIHWTFSPLPGGTTHPNTWFSTSVGNMLGFMVNEDIRFLVCNKSTMQQLKNSISNFPTCLQMAVIHENAKEVYSNVTVINSSIKVSGGGYILDLTLSKGEKAGPVEVTA